MLKIIRILRGDKEEVIKLFTTKKSKIIRDILDLIDWSKLGNKCDYFDALSTPKKEEVYTKFSKFAEYINKTEDDEEEEVDPNFSSNLCEFIKLLIACVG